ncbi:Rhs element Vgr family protein [Minicystis rosea]|nr:Rhs element Vgr family protein [Minicystis rosea]
MLRYELDERLAELGVLELALWDDAEEALPAPGEVLDKAAAFTLARSDGSQERSFFGTVIHAEVAPDDDDLPVLHVVVAPKLWNLTKRADCRIFQNKSTVDIVKEVLTQAGVPADQQDWAGVQEPPPERVYTVQYRETDLAFVHRLLFEEGIYFAIHHRDEKDVLVFGDRTNGLGEVEKPTSLPFYEDFGVEGSADRVIRLSKTTSVKSDKVFVRDYNYDKPSITLEATVEGKDEGAHALEVYEYPARCEDAAAAKRLANVLLDSMQAERDVVHGETGSLALWPGLRVSIDGHPYDPMNQEYLLTRSRITGEQPRHFDTGSGRAPKLTMEFWGVPTETTKYRPPRRLREQHIPGTQTAITTGPGGEEIHTDAGGHVKVSFHWDRSGKKDDTSSRWIRTSQLPIGGSMLLPRMKWEVTVRHVEGDGDRPFVLGRVYNAVAPPPYALPKFAARSSVQTATTPGGGSSNELRMSDTKGSEEMFVNASRDMTTHAKNNATESIGNNYTKKVGSNQTREITDSSSVNVGSNQEITVSGNQTIHVETFMADQIAGNHDLTVGGSRDMKVGGDHKRDVGGTSSLNVGSNQFDLVVGSVTDQTMASFKHDVGAALIELAVSDRTVTVGGNIDEHAGAVKVIAVRGGRGVNVGGSMNVKTVGAVVNVANADHTEQSGGNYTEVAVGAQLVKAAAISYEADSLLTVVMGASILSLTPASVAFLGLSAKLQGDVADTAILIVDN